ncbi:MAG: SpoIIE family protein phosphatase [Coriobacteriales bacterium]|nr:SpoIIE family protein phosphatase [Coriobacteriales bacterium]
MRKVLVFIGLCVAIIGAGWLDYITGLVPDVALFYLIPVGLAAAYLGIGWGVAVSAFAAVSQFVAHPARAVGEEPSILLVDALLHFTVFAGAAVTIGFLAARLRSIRELKARRDFDIGVARKLHDSMQVTDYRSVPGLDIAHCLVPARELGGDFLHIQKAPTGMFLCIGDISGKGMSAALFTALVHDSLKHSMDSFSGLDDLAQQLNERLFHGAPSEMFATAFLGLVDSEHVHFINAGHVPPLLRRAIDGEIVELTTASGLPFGVSENFPGRMGRVAFDPGDVLLAFTDGVTDSFALRGHASESMHALLAERFGEESQQIATAVIEAALGDPSHSQIDDIAVACLRRLGGLEAPVLEPWSI